jgi:Rad3-related DNA helicase
MANKWELKLHEDVEDPYFEITNGPISLVATCGYVGETEDEEDAIFKRVTDTLNESGIDFRSENALELDQHIELQQLQLKYDELKGDMQTRNKELSELYHNLLDKYKESEQEYDKLKEENKRLTQWKKEQMAVTLPVLEWGQKNPNLLAGDNIFKKVLEFAMEYERRMGGWINNHQNENNG